MFSDDWGRHPSSSQHVIRRLLPRYRVLWVNTIGTRAPSAGLGHRAAGRRETARPGSARPATRNAWPANLTVTSPRMWPWFAGRHDRWLNRLLLLRSLTPQVHSLPGPVAAITTIPIVADLVGRLPVDRWVYYCVDDFSQWPGLDQRTMRQTEERLIPRMDRIIAVSEPCGRSWPRLGRQTTLLTHGVDLAMWTTEKGTGVVFGRDGRTPENGSVENDPRPLFEAPKPWVVFWGVVDRRMDTLVRATTGGATGGGHDPAGGARPGSGPGVAAVAASGGPAAAALPTAAGTGGRGERVDHALHRLAQSPGPCSR